jgi:hypothetical protein
LQLDESIERLQDEVADLKSDRLKLQAQLTAAARRLGDKHRLMAEVCCKHDAVFQLQTGFCISLHWFNNSRQLHSPDLGSNIVLIHVHTAAALTETHDATPDATVWFQQ